MLEPTPQNYPLWSLELVVLFLSPLISSVVRRLHRDLLYKPALLCILFHPTFLPRPDIHIPLVSIIYLMDSLSAHLVLQVDVYATGLDEVEAFHSLPTSAPHCCSRRAAQSSTDRLFSSV